MEPFGRVPQRSRIRPALLEIIAHADSHPDTDEVLMVEQLRSVLAAIETPLDRLLAHYPRLAPAPVPKRGDYGSFARFRNPDRHGQILQEVT